MDNKALGITPALIHKLSGELETWKITRLDFYSKSSKIKKIEYLDDCTNLQELNLSYNYITKIENLHRLHKLKTLDLSENSIKKLENLNFLVALEHLNLAGNLLKEIEKENVKGLVVLNFLNISKNKIARISEFGNLAVLKNLESLCTAGNLVKQVDLKEYLPIRILGLKYLDGEAISHDASENASVWVVKDKIKGLKLELVERVKELAELKKDLNCSEESLKSIEKAGPDKKYMRELLDKADILHTTSENLQQAMAEARESLLNMTLRLESLKSESRATGNFIIDEIHLSDEIKKTKETIEELESQYAVVLEELEKIALEITKIDNIIHNTPKFNNPELSSLEAKSQILSQNIKEKNREIDDIKENIEECNKILGVAVEAREFLKVMEGLWKKFSDEVWVEESEDIVKEAKKWGRKISEKIDKERSEFAHFSATTTEEVKKLKQKVTSLTNDLYEENEYKVKLEGQILTQKNNFEKKIKAYEEKCGTIREVEKNDEDFDLEHAKSRLFSLNTAHSEKIKEIKNVEAMISERQEKCFEVSAKLKSLNLEKEKVEKSLLEKYGIDIRKKEFDGVVRSISKLAGVLGISVDLQAINLEIEKFVQRFRGFDEEFEKLKEKKKEFAQKNQEFLGKVKAMNQEKLEFEREKKDLKENYESLKTCQQEVHEKELRLEKIKEEKNTLANEKLKMSCQITTLKEEFEVHTERKFKLLAESQRFQTLFDAEKEKYDEIHKKTAYEKEKLQNFRKDYEIAEKNKENALKVHTELTENIKSKEKVLLYMEQKIATEEKQLRKEIESLANVFKKREAEIQSLNLEIASKEKTLLQISEKNAKKLSDLKKVSKEFESLQEKYKICSEKILDGEYKIDDIEIVNQKLLEEIRQKHKQLELINEEIRDKLQQIERIQTQFSNDSRSKNIMNEEIYEYERKLEELEKRCNRRNEEISKLNEIYAKKANFLNDLEGSENINPLGYHQSTEALSLNDFETFNSELKLLKQVLTQAQVKKENLLKEISKISSDFSTKEAYFTEKLQNLKSAIGQSEQTLSNLRKNIESLTYDLNHQEGKLTQTHSELLRLNSQKDFQVESIQSLSAEIASHQLRLEKLKIQEKESLIILALGGFDIDENFRSRISKFVNSLQG